MADNAPKPGQFVSRLLSFDADSCWITSVKGSITGGNGTRVYTVEVASFFNENRETILIVSTDTENREVTPWQCAVCECFTTCICPGASREE
jgi:hypothetical protein